MYRKYNIWRCECEHCQLISLSIEHTRTVRMHHKSSLRSEAECERKRQEISLLPHELERTHLQYHKYRKPEGTKRSRLYNCVSLRTTPRRCRPCGLFIGACPADIVDTMVQQPPHRLAQDWVEKNLSRRTLKMYDV